MCVNTVRAAARRAGANAGRAENACVAIISLTYFVVLDIQTKIHNWMDFKMLVYIRKVDSTVN